jgi:hypothetical protein
MIRIGVNEITIFTCSCGYRATNEEYMKQLTKSEVKNEKLEKKSEKKE